jgi:cbb3-type cytochrome oxidase subunit 3
MPSDDFLTLRTAPLIALGVYIALYLLGASLRWLAERRRDYLPRWLMGLWRSPAFPWGVELLRLAYYLLLPYYALVQGLISAQGLGIGEHLNWPQDILRAAGWTALALFLLSLSWWAFRRAIRDDAHYPPPENLMLSASPWGWGYTLREAAYLQMFWGFCRAVWVPFVGIYYGAFLGLGIVYLVGWLNPATRAGLALSGKREAIIHTASLALCSTVLYVQTGNLWLCFGMHALVELVLARTFFRPKR